MYRRNIIRACGLTAALLALGNSATAQVAQKPAKDLIVGTWTLMIADNIRGDTKVPGFGPLPKGTAKFEPDGRYSLEIMPNSSSHEGLSYSGRYTLDEAGKSLNLRVEESSVSSWRGTTQTGTMKFVSGDHLGWTNSVPLVVSGDFSGTELIWARAK